MKITPRRKEFLDKVKELCEQHGRPVHYDEVASALGTSKWTAYDMLKELEKQGLVSSAYTVKQGGKILPGRSRLSFWVSAPKTGETTAGYVAGAVAAAIEEHLGNEAMEEIKKRVERWTKAAGQPNRSFASCATFIVALLLLLDIFASPSISSVRAAVSSVPTADVGLLVFAGGAIGALLGRAKSIPAVRRVLEASRTYTRSLGALTEEAKEALFDMVKSELDLYDASRS